MKSHSSGIGRRLINDLRCLSYHLFQQRCGYIIQSVFPDVRMTPARGKLDRAGLDHCVFVDDGAKLDLVFQCKGFEVAEIGESQRRQCFESIKSFVQSEFKAKRYFLIVNRIAKGEVFLSIKAALDQIVIEKKADEAHFLSLESFLNFIFSEAQAQVGELLRKSTAHFREQHQTRMDEDVYVENVPFQLGDSATLRTNPLRFAEEQISNTVLAQHYIRSWTLVVGEFGFGKTSFALRLADALQKLQMDCVYLPAARFRTRSFEGEWQFLWEVWQILFQEEIDPKDEHHLIFHAALKEILKRDKRIVLILDGIDEHPACWRENGLINVFGIVKTFASTCLFTVRKEFYSDRAGHFRNAMKGGPDAFILRLLEWGDPLILEYTRGWRKRRLPSGSEERIDHFELAVKTGRYVEFYGDIPKRPLFLKMLLSDVVKQDIRTRNLAELYTIYLTEKFEMDRATSVQNPSVRRPLSMDDDYDFVCAQLFAVMTCAAGKMYRIENEHLRLVSELSEVDLRECAKKVADGSLDLPSILLNSVLVPIGRRRGPIQGGHLSVGFAHRSFQEFFLAQYLLHVLLGKTTDEKILSVEMPHSVMRFIHGLSMLLAPEEQQLVQAKLAQLPLVSPMQD